jgi:hypothetical protein
MVLLRECGEDEMIACFLAGELTSARFGPGIRSALAARGYSSELLTDADLEDEPSNRARRAVLGATRGYGQNRELFDASFPAHVSWVWMRLSAQELAQVRYMDYSYWTALSGGTRLPADAAELIKRGIEAFEISNQLLLDAAGAVARGEPLPPLILVGTGYRDLVCLEGHVRLTGYALAGFPDELDCLVGTAPTMDRWAH